MENPDPFARLETLVARLEQRLGPVLRVEPDRTVPKKRLFELSDEAFKALLESGMLTLEQVGQKLMTCQHCRTEFVSGNSTSKRSHAKYCSDRCRVAAMRARAKIL